MHRPLQNPWTRGELRLPKKQRTRVVRRNIAGVAAVALLFCCLHGGAAQYDTCTNGTVADIGNGLCDAVNNNPSCGYDGGDCCPCTCDDSSVHSCADNEFNCIFPECDDIVATSEGSTCIEGLLDDGFCDDGNNNPSCDYDGGDCCMCTCTDDDSVTVCGSSGFNCRDPACFDPAVVAEFPECTGDWLMVGDGKCQAGNNNPSCGYDGGDCCPCSCNGSTCASSIFNCLDPDAEYEFFECKAPPPSALPCSADVQRTWVVDNSAKAKALAAAVNCSGGSFEVEWRGSVVVDGPIYVTNGTILTITGVGSDALIDGNASTRLFTVVDASLHVSGVSISYGVSTVGGAIAAAGSSLTFDQTNFTGNTADGNGGAIYVSDRSIVSCAEGTFAYNFAGSDGGAMFVTGSSVVSCGGSWFENVAGDSGGALVVDDNSSVSWNDGAVFAYNSADRFGGAVYALLSSSVSWGASTLFYSNSAWFIGGAVYIVRASSISWTGVAAFDSNSVRSDYGVGGALAMALNSNASWSGSTAYMNNVAGGNGGGVFLAENSRASCTDETSSTFSGNSAAYGGALAVETNSSVDFRGKFSFDSNRAIETDYGTGYGGAVSVIRSATATWYGVLAFTGNTAIQGGGLYLKDSTLSWSGAAMIALNTVSEIGGAFYAYGSNVSWLGEVKLWGNTAGESGGAICSIDSNFSWVGETSFLSNSASREGGALYALSSGVSWMGKTVFFNNSAGAVYIGSSTLTWSGNTTLAHNRVNDGLGGALRAYGGSRVFWSDGATQFIENFAGVSGGALYVSESEVVWSGDTEFAGNSCGFEGSAINAVTNAHVSWGGGTTIFTRNNALFDGTISVTDSNVSWSGATEFVGNAAETSGGAVFIRSGAHVSWTGDTNFISNEARVADGGAIATEALGSDSFASDSFLVINGTTTFSNNIAGANGGGLALLGMCTLNIGTMDVTFVGNSAAVAGGAIFLSGTSIGPAFTDLSLISNSAAIGGAVSIFGSGTKEGGDFPTRFKRCRFVGNQATATGGAINSAAGKDRIDNSVFEDNSAGTGAAMRLAGAASIHNCSFVENTSDDGEGAAVSNIGYISSIENISFSGNGFDCPWGMFLYFNASDDPFEVLCHGCETTCNRCVFVEGDLAPTCREVMDHTTSDGGNVTLRELSVNKGYWRATPTSPEVLACYNADACLGGVTGTSSYCLDGYEGPYCSICSDGYTAQLGFSCNECSENNSRGIAVAVVLVVAVVITAVSMISYVMSGEAGLGAGQGVIDCLTRYIPLQSVKIVIVAWQILTQFASVANVTYPGLYQDLLNGLDVFNFDLGWVLSADCIFDIDFHDRLLVSTISPITALLFLACTYATATHINHGKPESLQNIRNKHVSMVLLLTFLVYSSVSATLFKTFACEELDDDKQYLRSDYRIECNSSKHKGFQVYAGCMIVLYTVGIPALYLGLLFRDRDVLRIKEADREGPPRSRVTSTSDLWKPYKPSVFYYEVIECGRRILLAGVVVFIYPNTAAQIAVTLVIAFAFALISEGLAPYATGWDTWISRIGHVVVFVSMYVALLLKVDVSDERASSQKVFETVLVAAHVCMVVVVVIEAVIAPCSFNMGQDEQPEHPSPRIRGGRSFGRNQGRGRGRRALRRWVPYC
eukprot:jgi/Undpi1/13834/HiC_scaffold_9.g03485.m1